MTVGELMKELQTCDPNARITVIDEDSWPNSVDIKYVGQWDDIIIKKDNEVCIIISNP